MKTTIGLIRVCGRKVPVKGGRAQRDRNSTYPYGGDKDGPMKDRKKREGKRDG